ncbi:Uncharacterised protein [Mycobacteroides abscessus subsp. bolletii]|nr:Uncharacterised protein [Mycobacteroides abscessus subsp. bolletii]SKX37447.1 Uncharacterised protein [Mycobacteroides abscessus subsp. bolletii]
MSHQLFTSPDSADILGVLSPRLLTRQDVRVSRTGWITDKEYDETVGLVSPDLNPTGQQIWRAHARDIGGWAHSRTDAVLKALEIHNIQEKARAYDLLAPLTRRPLATDSTPPKGAR